MRTAANRLLMRLIPLLAIISALAGCGTVSAQHGGRFDRATLAAIVAPIALYPDPLLAQVLMASTYPREIEEAARWSAERPGLSGDAAVRIARDQDWDPSVRSLLAFPLVLDTMARHMRWTEDLGDAFLDQREDVMRNIQRLRLKAYESGNLRSNDYVRVVNTGDGITIESASPQIVHVPHYDPRAVYGTWRSAAPPVHWSRWPLYYDPPGRPVLVHWDPGIGISSGFFFGGFYWPRREVRIVNVHTYYYPRTVVIERPLVIERRVEFHRPAPVHVHRDDTHHVWRHDDARKHRAPIAAHTHPDRARLAPVITPAPNAQRENAGHSHRPNHAHSSPATKPQTPTASTTAATPPVQSAGTRPAPVAANDEGISRGSRRRDGDNEPVGVRRHEPRGVPTGSATSSDPGRPNDGARNRADTRNPQDTGNDERRRRRSRDAD